MENSSFREPTQLRSQQTLERIMLSSTRLISERSYDDVTIADIAAEAEISVGAFYSRFRNKEALFSKLRENLAQETQSRINDALATDWSEISLHDLLLNIVTNNVELYEKYRGVLTAIYLSTRVLNSSKNDELDSYNQNIVSQIETLLLRKRDELRHARPRVAIRMAIACMASMLREAIVFNDRSLYPKPRDSVTVSRHVTRVIYQYLAKEVA